MSNSTNTGATAGSISNSSESKSSDNNMADKQEESYAQLGMEVAQTLTAANSMSEKDVKTYKAAIYNLFKGVPQTKVDFFIVAYFLLNDPSTHADWGKANPIVIGGIVVKAVEIAGGVINMALGDGLLRKFLSTAYEKLVPTVIKNTPKIAEYLNARAASYGVVGADPISVVSWVRGMYPETSANAGVRALLRDKATRHKGSIQVQELGGSVEATAQPVVKPSTQDFF